MLHFCKTNFANIHHIALYLAVSLTHIPGSYGAPNTDQNESNEIEENERKKNLLLDFRSLFVGCAD